MTRSLRVGLAAAALLVMAGLTACTGGNAPERSAAPTPTIATAHWSTAGLYSTGRDATTVTMPRGARTLHVDFSCTSGLYEVAPAMGMDSRSGMCGGAQSFDFDVAKTAPGTRIEVDFLVPADTRFVANIRFSPEAFAPDPVTRTQCASLSSITEAYQNADEAVDHGDATTAQWMQKTATAEADLTELAAKDKSGPSTGLLGPVIQQLAAWLTGPGNHPGGLMHAPLGDFTAAHALAAQICSANGTPITIRSSYGG